ncbi:MAG: hypothetical protein OXE85_11300 [Roseovarius sp.]|nr:hypothetical protein [Roseovarius sp.]
MGLDLANYENQALKALKLFWRNREEALARQIESGNRDARSRDAVTAGKNMDGFLAIARSLIEANGLSQADICDSNVSSPCMFFSTNQALGHACGRAPV